MTQPIVSVRGEATLEADPEIAVFTVSVTATAHRHDDAVETLNERADKLASALDDHARAIEKRETSGLSVYPVLDDNGRIRRHEGTFSMTVTVSDFTALSDLVLTASAVEQASVHGPWWQLRSSSDVYRQARMAAVGDAVRRAREYAAAFGVTLTGLLEVADRGMSSSGSGAGVQLRAAHASASHGRSASFDFEPSRQQVFGQIEARFSIEEPDLHSLPG